MNRSKSSIVSLILSIYYSVNSIQIIRTTKLELLNRTILYLDNNNKKRRGKGDNLIILK